MSDNGSVNESITASDYKLAQSALTSAPTAAADNAKIGTVAIQNKSDSQTATSLGSSEITVAIVDSSEQDYTKIDGTVASGIITFAQNGSDAPEDGTYTATITETATGLEIGTVTITIQTGYSG